MFLNNKCLIFSFIRVSFFTMKYSWPANYLQHYTKPCEKAAFIVLLCFSTKRLLVLTSKFQYLALCTNDVMTQTNEPAIMKMRGG